MTAGGKREGAGRKLKYGEPVKRLFVKVPASKEKEIKGKIMEILKEYIVKPGKLVPELVDFTENKEVVKNQVKVYFIASLG